MLTPLAQRAARRQKTTHYRRFRPHPAGPMGQTTYAGLVRMCGVALQRLFDPADQFVVGDRLAEKGHHAGSLHALRLQRVSPAGDDDGWRLDLPAAQEFDEFQPIHSGHVQVEQQATRLGLPHVGQIGGGGRIVSDRMAIGFDENPHGVADRIVIVHNANCIVAIHRT